MSLEETFDQFSIPHQIRRVQKFLSKDCKYDNESITYDKRGNILAVKRRPAIEVERDRKCICLDALFYAAWKLRNSYTPRIITIAPIISYAPEQDMMPKTGYWHALYPFKHKGKFGAIGKSRNPNLEFQPPIFSNISNLIFFNDQLMEGYLEHQNNRELPFVGLIGTPKPYLLSNRFTRYSRKIIDREHTKPVRFDISLFHSYN